MDRSQAEELLRQAVADPAAEFRPGQWEAIEAIAIRRSKVLVVERTGWGKSTVYFISTRILRDQGAGPTIIVSPLLALMRNQVESGVRLGVRTATINSSNRADWDEIKDQILRDEVDAVLISPERLANEKFVEEILLPISNRAGLLVVDEAHCISDWGHDFRPDYRRIVNILSQMPPNMPVLGTTATANDRVVNDIQEQVGGIEIQRGPLTRDSLALQTLRLPDAAARLAWLAKTVPDLPGTGIIYALTKRDANLVASWLRLNGIEAWAYHSSVQHPDFDDTSSYRIHLENLLLGNDVKVLVATIALGMGYDKPDVSFAIHYQAPGSIVSYYQQVGRAGRNIPTAFGVMLSGSEDDKIHEYFRRNAFPAEKHISSILEVLEQSDGMSARKLEAEVNLRRGQIEAALKFLSVENPSPVLKESSQWRRTPVVYQLDQEKIERLTSQREREWAEVKAYLEHPGCLMDFLRRALDDPESGPCGRCANCIGKPLLSEDVDHDLGVRAAEFLRHTEMPLQLNKQVAAGAFEVYELRGNLSEELRAETGRVLARWGDAGWGQDVADDKHDRHFSDELVAASADLIHQRWQPDPPPTWVTCVPSRMHPDLVPDFARRLADRLGLPFVPAIEKIRDNEPQKLQQNRFRQCNNLDGVFEVSGDVSEGAVLLVDDIVDSRWTLTVVAALLRAAGSGPVFPFVLATTGHGD